MNKVRPLLPVLLSFLALTGLPALADTPQGRCTAIPAPTVPGALVLSVSGVERPAGPAGNPGRPPIADVPARCEVTVVLSHRDAGERVQVQVWLPLRGWNGRFLGTGGGGYATGLAAEGLAPGVKRGYASVATDGGIGLDPISPAAWALNAHGQVNWGLLTNFGNRSVHDMTVVGKAVTTSYYGQAPTFSYWDGCSTGGRQGLAEAQLHPEDYDGVVAGAPSLDVPRLSMAKFWPQVVMSQERTFPSPCEFNAFTRAAVDACDGDDGITDGVIGDPLRCRFNPQRLIGTKIHCGGKDLAITAATAAVVQRIWEGPHGRTGKLGHGLIKGAPFANLMGVPLSAAENWIKYFLARDPAMDTSKITYADFERLTWLSTATYDHLLANTDPNLSKFRAAGGKLIVWHGLSDAEIAPNTTIDYRHQVERVTGGANHADEFLRLFLAPGTDHCGHTKGTAPIDPLAAVVAWVEHGKAPDTLPSATKDSKTTRNLCRYPRASVYKGHGDPTSADNFHCVTQG